jgi:PilZ domain
MVEDRKTRAPRYRVSEGATIEFGDRTISCLVRNLSATGAAIEVPNEPGIPPRFELNIPRLGLRMTCRVAWRRDHRMGVAFIVATPDKQPG